MPRLKRKHLIKHTTPKILWQLRIFGLVSLIMFGIVGYDILTDVIGVSLAIVGLIIGLVVGIISSRMSHLSWDKDGQRVVSRYDAVGVIILIGYISLSVFRNRLVSLFLQGPQVTAFSFSLIAATMLGRVIGTRNGIHGILRDEGIIS
jgi:hypothetical protein